MYEETNMLSFNRIKNFFTEKEHELTIHDLVREQLKAGPDDHEYHLKNISSINQTEKHVINSVPSPVHENLLYAEKRLAELMDMNEKKALETLKIVEQLECSSSKSWTDVVKLNATTDD